MADKSDKGERKTDDTARPVCTALLACNFASLADNKAISLIEVIDTFTMPAMPAELQDGDALAFANSKLVILLRAGKSTGRHTFQLKSVGPSGQSDELGIVVEDFTGMEEHGGFNLTNELVVKWHGVGMYWLELWYSEELVIKTPLKVQLADAK